MMQNLLGIGALGLAVVLVFVAVASMAVLTTDKITNFMEFYRSKFTANAQVEMGDMFISTDPTRLFWLNILCLIFIPLFVHLLFALWVITGLVFAVLLIVPGLLWARLRNKRFHQLETQFPDAFMMLSSSLQAGASLHMAFQDLVKQSPAPINQEFGLLVKRMQLGVSLEDGLIELEKRVPIQSFVMASSAIRISREVGGNLVETINSMADTLRRKQTMEGKIDSLTAQGKAQGTFMAMVPVGLALILSFFEPEAMRKLYTTREGLMVLSAMIVMQVMGFVFIRKITSIDS
jgi:tight adherence protein B